MLVELFVFLRLLFFKMRIWKESVHSDSNQCADNGIENSLNRVGGILAGFHIEENNKESRARVNHSCFIESIAE